VTPSGQIEPWQIEPWQTEPWQIETRRSSPSEAFAPPEIRPRMLVVREMDRPALVLGSGQGEFDIDREGGVGTAHHDVSVVRRRSGGGAVWVDADLWWADLSITADDPLWSEDVGRAFHWVGALFSSVVASLVGPHADLRVHTGALVSTPWSRVVCFAGVGPGEVCLARRKVVGISQRRVREGACFQVGVLLRWQPQTWCELLRVPLDALRDVAVGIRDLTEEHIDHGTVTAAVSAALKTELSGL
jgi:lipoate---protein ligase